MMSVSDWSSRDKTKLFRYLGVNSYRSERHKLFYVATPKAACTLLKWWFADMEGYTQALRETKDSTETAPDLVIHDSFHRVAPEVTGLNAEALAEPLTSDDYFRFAVVRNPYRRIFSAWQSKLLLREPLQVKPYLNCDFNQPIDNASDIGTAFEGFLEYLKAHEAPNFRDFHWTPQATLLRPDLINYSKLVKIENAKELSTALSGWLGPQFVDPFASRGMNESLIPYLPEYVTNRSAELIRKLYAEDFDVFGYSTLPPESKENFSADQFDLAMRAISMIRGRHQRFGEVCSHFSQIIGDLKRDMANRDLLTSTVFSKAQIERFEQNSIQPDKMLKELVLSLARAGHHKAVANIHGKLAELIHDGLSAFMTNPDHEVDLQYSIGLYQDGYIHGWILDKNRPLQKVAIEISQNQRVIARGIADQFRRDLAEAEIGDGCCAFKLKADISPTLNGGAIVLRAVEFDKEFRVQPATVRGVS